MLYGCNKFHDFHVDQFKSEITLFIDVQIRFVIQCTTILNMQSYFEYFCIFYTLVLVHINCILLIAYFVKKNKYN